MSANVISDLLATANAVARLVDWQESPGGAGGVVYVDWHGSFFSVNQQSGDGGWQSGAYRSRIDAELAAVLLADFCQAEFVT